MGTTYDIGHATIEGGSGRWVDCFRIPGAHLKESAVKELVNQSHLAGTLQIHFEYPLGGAHGLKNAQPAAGRSC